MTVVMVYLSMINFFSILPSSYISMNGVFFGGLVSLPNISTTFSNFLFVGGFGILNVEVTFPLPSVFIMEI